MAYNSLCRNLQRTLIFSVIDVGTIVVPGRRFAATSTPPLRPTTLFSHQKCILRIFQTHHHSALPRSWSPRTWPLSPPPPTPPPTSTKHTNSTARHNHSVTASSCPCTASSFSCELAEGQGENGAKMQGIRLPGGRGQRGGGVQRMPLGGQKREAMVQNAMRHPRYIQSERRFVESDC